MSEDTNIRISPKAMQGLKEIKGQILIEDHENKPIREIIEEMVTACLSSIESSKALKNSSQAEK